MYLLPVSLLTGGEDNLFLLHYWLHNSLDCLVILPRLKQIEGDISNRVKKEQNHIYRVVFRGNVQSLKMKCRCIRKSVRQISAHASALIFIHKHNLKIIVCVWSVSTPMTCTVTPLTIFLYCLL